MRVSAVACFGLLLAAAAVAQPNDVGLQVEGAGPTVIGSAVPEGVTCPAGPEAHSFSGATTQSGRIFRDAIPSVCPTKVYPGIFNVGTIYNYEAFTYPNTSGAAACVTVNFDVDSGATPCGTNAHASAYIGSYDPNNQAANFVGDVGSSVTQPFSFEVPANSDLVLVVTNTSAQAVCDFSFEVVNLPCDLAPPVPDWQVIPTADYRGLIALAVVLAAVGVFALSRLRG